MAKRVFKTKRVLSGARTIYRAWKEWDEGDIVIATFKGTSQNRKNKAKVDWIVFIEDAFFADKKEQKRVIGNTLTLNCAGQLDNGMKQVEVGETVQVTYNGCKEMQGGDYEGQMAHLMEVITVEEDDGSDSLDEDIDEAEEEDDDDL